MIGKPFDLVVLFVAVLVIVATRRDYRKRLVSERVVIMWSVGAICGAVLAVMPRPFELVFRVAGVINYPSAPIVLAILFLFVATYEMSRKLGRTSRALRTLTLRDAVRQVREQARDTARDSDEISTP